MFSLHNIYSYLYLSPLYLSLSPLPPLSSLSLSPLSLLYLSSISPLSLLSLLYLFPLSLSSISPLSLSPLYHKMLWAPLEFNEK